MKIYDIISSYIMGLVPKVRSKQYSLCGYCQEPITNGLVMVAEIDGKKVTFHRQSGWVGQPNAALDCSRSYIIENGAIHGNLMDFSNFEKLVLNQAPLR